MVRFSGSLVDERVKELMQLGLKHRESESESEADPSLPHSPKDRTAHIAAYVGHRTERGKKTEIRVC